MTNEELQISLDRALARVAELEHQRDEFERKGKELCVLSGNLMLERERQAHEETQAQHQQWINRIHALNIQVSQLGEDKRILAAQLQAAQARNKRFGGR